MTLLEIENLTVEYDTERGPLRAVDDVSLEIEEGTILGLVGESGCGKTTLGKSILGLLPQNGRIAEGSIRYKGDELVGLTEKELNQYRWKEISMIVQNAMNALDPVHTIGSLFVEAIRNHRDVTKQEARDRAESLLRAVDIDPSRMNDYGFELSGGQRQRVIIALALVLDPPLVVADEPTTGLDVIVQDNILDLITDLQTELGNSMIIITHDMSVVAEIADEVAVMYGGKLMEWGTAVDVFDDSSHPYTIGLRNAFPELGAGRRQLVSIPGMPPDLVNPPEGCRFKERCPFETEECSLDPPLAEVHEGHVARCHYTDQSEEFQERGADYDTWVPEEQEAIGDD